MAALPAWRLWAVQRASLTELDRMSIDDVEDAWSVLEAVAEAERRETPKKPKR